MYRLMTQRKYIDRDNKEDGGLTSPKHQIDTHTQHEQYHESYHHAYFVPSAGTGVVGFVFCHLLVFWVVFRWSEMCMYIAGLGFVDWWIFDEGRSKRCQEQEMEGHAWGRVKLAVVKDGMIAKWGWAVDPASWRKDMRCALASSGLLHYSDLLALKVCRVCYKFDVFFNTRQSFRQKIWSRYAIKSLL